MDWLSEYIKAWSRYGIHFRTALKHLNIIDPPASAEAVIVEDECLVYRFPHSHRTKAKRGHLNDRFLNPASLLRLLDGLSEQVMVLLSVPQIYRTEDLPLTTFLDKVDQFLSALPRTWRYAIELHNKNYLLPDYFECLRRNRAAHVIRDSIVFTADFGLIRATEQSEIVLAVRQAMDEKRTLYVYVDGLAELSQLMELLNNDLKRLSPIKGERAA